MTDQQGPVHHRAARRQAALRWPSRVAVSLVALGACAEACDPGGTPPGMGQDVGSTFPVRDAAASTRDAGASTRDAGASTRDAGASTRDASGGARDAGGGARDAASLDPEPALTPGRIARASLASDHVVFSTAGRNVLYTWTTDAQAMELRSSKVLLTRSERSDGTRTVVSAALATLAASNNALAKLLSGPDYQKGRFGWPNAWATLRGWPGESYGTALVRIVLKPEAWIARLSRGRLDVVDLQGTPVDASTALASPGRIAAVYFVSEGEDPEIIDRCGGTYIGCAPSAYREFFVNNERMVQEWSLATDTILAEIDRGRRLAGELRAAIVSGTYEFDGLDECNLSSAAVCSWDSSLDTSFWGYEDYTRALALTSEHYAPTTDNMDALASALDAARFVPDPFVVTP